ncbi:MAG: methyltransferase domain-containing protein [Acidimicrobiia bacterium]
MEAETEATDLDGLLAELRARVDQRRRDGLYPDDLEETLDEHFERLIGSRSAASPAVYDELSAVVDALQNFEYSRERIDAGSEVPGGQMAHLVVGKVVSRQVQGVLEQSQAHAHLIGQAISLVSDIAAALGRTFDTNILQQLDDLQTRLAAQHRQLNEISRTFADVLSRVPGYPVSTWYGEERFTAHFRGTPEDLRSRYRDLAGRFVGCDPVLDVGFGRGEFLELLAELGVSALGVEPDARLVTSGRARGLDVQQGSGVEFLTQLEPQSLGGLAMIQVIEHLPPQQVVDVVALAAEKVRPQGLVVIETVNPASLYTYSHAFWVDPDHARPVHPAFLVFLFQEAGFRQIEIEERSPVPEPERLELLAGDDESTQRMNRNLDRINSLLYGAQDYAVIATR